MERESILVTTTEGTPVGIVLVPVDVSPSMIQAEVDKIKDKLREGDYWDTDFQILEILHEKFGFEVYQIGSLYPDVVLI